MRGTLFKSIAVVGLLLSGRPGFAQLVGGGGSPATDCWVTYDSHPAANKPASRPNRVECADQDSTCGDADAALGYCSFDVQVAFNSTTGFGSCAPTAAPAGSFAIPYSGPTNDDHPKHNADFEPFVQFAEDHLPLTTGDTDVVSGFKPVSVPLSIRFGASGPRFRNTTVMLKPTQCAAALLSNGKCPSGIPNDKDTFKLTCTVPVDSMTGAKISPCTGILSTFQQIQEHIFDRKCSTMATCHGSADSMHDLCLKPACGARSAYTDLVGVTPHNFAAATDGLKRVEPGNPQNSLLFHKISGGALLNSTTFGPGTYGARMPYHSPATDRARPKLSSGEIRLINDWILAGAPQTGFVTSLGACQ